MKNEKVIIVFSMVLQISGYVLLAFVDSRIAVGIFLIHWSISIDRNVFGQEEA